MDLNERGKNTRTPPYPQNVDEWRETIGKARCQASTFPFNDLIVWIRQEFSADKGYSPDFAPALIRNHKGLIDWVYGDGSEPYWPGHNEGNY